MLAAPEGPEGLERPVAECRSDMKKSPPMGCQIIVGDCPTITDLRPLHQTPNTPPSLLREQLLWNDRGSLPNPISGIPNRPQWPGPSGMPKPQGYSAYAECHRLARACSRVAARLLGPHDSPMVSTSLQHAHPPSPTWWLACDGGSLSLRGPQQFE